MHKCRCWHSAQLEVRLILVDMYEVTESNSFRNPERPKLIDSGGHEMEGQLRPSPTGPSTSLPPLTFVGPIVPTFAICLATASLTLIERNEHYDAGSDYTDGRDSLYVTLLFDWCGPYSFELCGDVRSNRPNTSRSPYNPNTTTVTAITNDPSRFNIQFGPPVPALVGFQRKFCGR